MGKNASQLLAVQVALEEAGLCCTITSPVGITGGVGRVKDTGTQSAQLGIENVACKGALKGKRGENANVEDEHSKASVDQNKEQVAPVRVRKTSERNLFDALSPKIFMVAPGFASPPLPLGKQVCCCVYTKLGSKHALDRW